MCRIHWSADMCVREICSIHEAFYEQGDQIYSNDRRNHVEKRRRCTRERKMDETTSRVNGTLLLAQEKEMI